MWLTDVVQPYGNCSRSWFFIGLLVVVILSGCGPEEKKPFLNLAKADIANSRPDSAIINLKQALQENSKDLEARLLLGKLYLQQGEFARAVANLDKASRVSPEHVGVLLALGQALVQSGDFKKLLDKIKPTTNLDESTRSNVHGLRAQAHLAMGRLENAKAELEKTSNIKQQGKENLLARVQLELAENRTEKAEQYLKQAMAKYSGDSRFELLLAKAQLDAGNIEQGTTGFTQLMDKKSSGYSSAVARQSGYELIKAQVSQGEFEAAEKLVRKLLSTDKRDFRALYFGGLVALISGNYGLAERRLVRLEKSYSIESVRLLLGVVFMATKSYERSRFYLENYYHKHRDDLWVAKLLIRNYLILGELKHAEAVFDYVKKGNFDASNDAEILILRAMLYAGQNNSDRAREYLKKASPLVAENIAARKLLSKAYLDIGDLDVSLTHAGYVLQQEPGDIEALEISVSAQIQKKNMPGVDTLIRAYKNAGGDTVTAENLLGLAMLYLGQYKAASEHFEEILQHNPRQPDARINRAKAIELGGDFLKANELYLAMVVYPERRKEALHGLIRSAYLANDDKKMEAAVEIARSYDYKSVEPLLYHGAHFIRQGNFARAQDMVREVGLVSPGHPAEQLLRAGIELERENYKAAELITYKLLTDDPSDKPTLMLMADLQNRLGNVAAANKYLTKAGHDPIGKNGKSMASLGTDRGGWVSNILPVLRAHSSRNFVEDKTIAELLDLDNSEIQLASTRSGLDLADSGSLKRYSYGKSGSLARINRTLFFKFYGSFAQGAVGEGEMARRVEEGFFDEYDPDNMGAELNQIVNHKKEWGPKSSYRDFKRTLRTPSLVAIVGIVMILIVLGVRWSRSRDLKNPVKDY